MELLVPLIVLALCWVVLILPQQRRVRAHRAYVAALSVGDDVVTTAGLYGTILALDAETARLEIAPGVVVTIARRAIGAPQVDPAERAAHQNDDVAGAGVDAPSSTADEPTPDESN